MPNALAYRSYCWSLGTTSFRTKNFNKTIEEQLALLDEFWTLDENRNETWAGNAALQTRYYDFMRAKGFVEGEAGNKPKDGREKTSGLVDIGLIDGGRRLTNAGKALLRISAEGDFSPDGRLGIARDSYIYLKQLLKTYYTVDGHTVRPFLVLLHLLDRFGYLTLDEYTYLLPLCIGERETEEIARGIGELRAGNTSVDDIITGRLLDMPNYRAALTYLLENEATEELICEIGFNRKSRRYDRPYHALYNALFETFVNKRTECVPSVYLAAGKINIGSWWRGYLFDTASAAAIRKDPAAHLRPGVFDDVTDEESFKRAFFNTMHLFKAKATLADYLDLNRRYIRTTDVVLFEDGIVRLDIAPRHFFKPAMQSLYSEAFTPSELLHEDCAISDISAALAVSDEAIAAGIGEELGVAVSDMRSAREALEDVRYRRLQHLIDTKFTDAELLTLLDCFERRSDAEIRAMVTDNADIPTIFEYVLGILWYKVSERRGRILDYMKLSLDADLLPKTHAAGGEADIVYEYEAAESYPEHTLLLEATLADSTNQRRMEMEPVSRHLGRHLLRTGNADSYCVFVSNYLDINVIADFRGRKTTPFYDPQDYSRSVVGMKIIPLRTAELKKIVAEGKTYRELYPMFEAAFRAELPPHEWYGACIRV